jgi:hypothetical protein
MVNFIIRDGDKFVLNGNELMRTENPVLEVPDIVGSEEVTEKIAEDVQVGDLLYNVVPYFDESKMMLPRSGASPTFIELDDGLHCFVFDATIVQVIDYVYKDEKWTCVNNAAMDSISDAPTTNNAYPDIGSCLKTEDGRVIISYGFAGGWNPGFHVAEYNAESNLATQGYNLLDASAWPDIHNYGTNQWRWTYSTDLYEASGTTHLAVGFWGQEGVSQPLATYRLDHDNKRIIPVTFDASCPGSTSESVKMMEFNNELYLLVATSRNDFVASQNLSLFKYNSSTDHWDFVSYNEYVSSTTRGISTIVTSSNEWFVTASRGTSYYLVIWKFNESTQQFEEYFDFDSLDASAKANGYGRDTTICEYDGSAHVILVSDFSTVSGTDMFLYRQNPSTSSFEFIPSAIHGTFSIRSEGGYGFTSTTYPNGGDTIVYDNDFHFVITNGEAEQVSFMKWNPTTNKFDRNMYLDTPSGPDGDSYVVKSYDFSGRTFVGAGFQYFPEIAFAEYVSSGDYFLPMKGPDLDIVRAAYDLEFYEVSGNLRCIASLLGSPSYMMHFQFDEAENQFKKLADPSALPTANSRSVAVEEFSGTTYIAMSYQASPYLITYYVDTDGSSLIKLPDPSSTSPDYSFKVDLKAHNGELHLIVPGGNDVLPNAYKLNNGVWEDVTVTQNAYQNLTLANRTYSASLYTIGDDLYFLESKSGNKQFTVYKYDGSGWEEDLNESPIKPFVASFIHKHVEHNGEQYFGLGGAAYGMSYRSGVLRRDTSGIWSFYPVEAAGTGDYQSHGWGILSMGNKIHYLASGANNLRTMRRWVMSEFLNEKIWKKNLDYENITQRPFATGIALESGSKGDTIKIRKVKR